MTKKLFKRFVLILAVFSLVFSVTIYAEDIVSIETDENFFVFSKDADRLSQIFGMTKEELEANCKQDNIVYLAADEGNSRQIRVTMYKNEFSNSVVNLSSLSDNNVSALTEDIVGIKDVRGEVVNKNGQKFLKISVRSDDSGGGYKLTQYFTVADGQNVVLSFYNSLDVNIDYIKPVFESYTSPLFINEIPNQSKVLYYVIPAAIGVLLVASLVLGISVYKDLKSAKEVEYDENGIPIDPEETDKDE